jgi:hypothetical protein
MSQVQTSLAISATVATATAVKIRGTRIARDLRFDFFGGLGKIEAGLGEGLRLVFYFRNYTEVFYGSLAFS